MEGNHHHNRRLASHVFVGHTGKAGEAGSWKHQASFHSHGRT